MALLKCSMTKFVVHILLYLYAVAAIGQSATVHNGTFRSVFDFQMQTPSQVSWTVRASDLGELTREPTWKFRRDVHDPRAKVRHSDYAHSGFDRGHLCPAADRSLSRDSMRATFVLSNCCPQVPALNRGAWLQSEIDCRKAAIIYDSVRVLALPVQLDDDTLFIGRHRVAVPDAFVKVAWLPVNDSIIGQWFFFNR